MSRLQSFVRFCLVACCACTAGAFEATTFIPFKIGFNSTIYWTLLGGWMIYEVFIEKK